MNNKSTDKTILITRSKEESQKDFVEIEKRGAKVIYYPTIEASPIFSKEFDNHLSNIKSFDYIIFTSKNSVKFFLERVTDLGLHPDYSKIRIVATGNKTADLLSYNGITVDLTPQKYSAEGVLELLQNCSLNNKNVLIPCSAIARNELSIGLKTMNANVYNIPIYEISLPEKYELTPETKYIKEHQIDIFAFTSPSSFNNYELIFEIENTASYFKNKTIVAIGETTAQAIMDKGIKVDIIPTKFNVEALASAILKIL
ncbi:MAG: uroporphyrinogen-III synthase [Melioribacteraceae bacterium]|nr:uroporphyrinogen-III synthase [Melioribacteraceae bacterium]